MSTINPVFTKVYRDKILGLVGNDTNLGDGAGEVNQGTDCVAIGKDAGHEDQGNQAIAIGQNAAYEGQGNYGVSIGQAAGAVNQGTEAISIGHGAAADTQGAQSVAIGKSAGYEDQQAKSIAIGFEAGMTDQATQAIAIGTETAKTNQATNAIAIGTSAGSANQEEGCISIGYGSGVSAQKSKSVSIGYNSGRTSQLADGVAIGNSAAYEYQQGSAVAIGPSAGYSTQGEFAIAIGKGAGKTNQAEKSIVINASGIDLNNTSTGTCKISPIAQEIRTSAQYPLFYNINTKEVCTSTSFADIIDYVATSGTDLTCVNFSDNVNNIRITCYDLQQLGPAATTIRVVLGSDSGYWTNTACYDGIVVSTTLGGTAGYLSGGTIRFNTLGYIPWSVIDMTSSDKASFTIDFTRVKYTTILGNLRDTWQVSGSGYIFNSSPGPYQIKFDGQIISPSAYATERCDRIKIYNTSAAVGGTNWAGGYVAIYTW